MTERPIGRDVVARQRFARLMSLGDRREPSSWSPAIILGDEDPDVPISIAPLLVSRSSSIPAIVKVSMREKLCFPFEKIDHWTFSEGLNLPPSLVESDSGEFGSGLEAIPVTWNSLHNDKSLNRSDLNPSLIILTDALQLSHGRDLLEKALLTIRTKFPASLIWAPGISGPDNCALLSWMGVDIFDLSRSRQASSLGILLTESGPRKVEPSTGEKSSIEDQCELWISAISATRSAIRDGSLRELAEKQSFSSPRSVEHLRSHDKLSLQISNSKGIFSSSVSSLRKLRCHSFESRNDPLIADWRKRVSENFTPALSKREILVLLPCSARKPYKLSQSHSRFRKALRSPRFHEVMVTAPLGLVPRELEELWPAAHYDIPVSGDWDEDEIKKICSMLKNYVERLGFSRIINHSGIEFSLEGFEVIDTRDGKTAGSRDALSRLEEAAQSSLELLKSDEHIRSPRFEDIKSISRFIYGSDNWLEGAIISGRPPILTIYKDGEQLAKWNPRMGRFAFSKSSLSLLQKCGTLKEIHLKEETEWIGDIFPPFVKSFDSGIRFGEELLVFQKNKLIGSARAVAPGWEWPVGPGKLAKTRHRLLKRIRGFYCAAIKEE